MNITEAIDLIRDVVNGKWDLRDERTYRSDEWQRVVQAWGLVESSATPRSTVNAIVNELQDIEQILAEHLVDAQDAAEEAGNFSPGFFTGDNDDIPICVPEDASPELDGARTSVREAIDILKEYEEGK